MGQFAISLGTGETGPVVSLSGESDVTTAAQVSAALTAQISAGARHLIVDLSLLRFADSASIRVFIEAHRALRDRGGVLELTAPQETVARSLQLLGVDQVITVRPAIT
jgi:anti-sigma B factor antagonist